MWNIIGYAILIAFAIMGALAAWDLTDYAKPSEFLEALNITLKRKNNGN